MRDKGIEEQKKERDYFTPKLESKPIASANKHKPSCYGEMLRDSYVTEIHISNTALVTASKPQSVCDGDKSIDHPKRSSYIYS